MSELLHSLVKVSGIFVSFDRKPYVGFFSSGTDEIVHCPISSYV